MVICLERGADLHTAQLMPLPLTVSYFSKIQIGFSWYRLTWVVLDKGLLNRCVCVYWGPMCNLPSTMSLVVNEERLRQGQWFEWVLSALCLLQCFDTWLGDSKDMWPVKNLCHFSLHVLFCIWRRRKIEKKLANPDSPGKWRWVCQQW